MKKGRLYIMCRKTLTLLSVFILIFSVFGCGIKNVLPEKEIPPLESYHKVALVLFGGDSSGEYGKLPTLLSYSIGTKLSIRYKDRVFLFDQSQTVHPISDKLSELSIRPGDIYEDPHLAIELAEALEADLVIVGHIYKPKFTEERSGKMEYDMTKHDRSGTVRFYSIYQTALLRSDFEIIDPTSGEAIWDGMVIGYKKYKTRYHTGNPPLRQSEESMLAEVRRDLAQQVVDKLYPA
jgi:hypothetical protein